MNRLLLALLLLVPLRGFASEQAIAPQKDALVVFLTYRGARALSLDPTEMRLAGDAAFRGVLLERGHEVVSFPELEALLRERRIRWGRNVDFGLLSALDSLHASDRLLLVDLVVYPDRLIALARGVGPSFALLASSQVIEEPCGDLWSDSLQARRNWNDAIRRAADGFASGSAEPEPRSAREAVILLPVRPVGIGLGLLDVTTHCLMASLLESGRWDVVDPFVVEAALRAEGHRPDPLDKAARGFLTSRFAPRSILAVRLVSFGWGGPSAGASLADEDVDARATMAFELGTADALYLNLLAVDGDSGRIVAGGAEYLEPEDPLGMFGILRNLRVADRLKAGTDRLVKALESGEES